MKKALMLFVLIIFVGCSPYHVRTDFNPEVDFGEYKTFNWLKSKKKPRAGKPYQTLHEQRIKSAIENELVAKGFSLADTEKPDMLLNFHVATQNKVDVTHYGYRPGRWGFRGPGYTTVHKYKEGTFILDVVNPVEREMIWRGTVSGIVLKKQSGEEEIYKIVEKLVENFPPETE